MKFPLLSLVLVIFLAGSAPAVCPVGDLDDDCDVDWVDLMNFAEQWLDNPGGSANIDGVPGVNMGDFAMLAENWGVSVKVVINEIHTDPDIKTEQVEFVELYNPGDKVIDMNGWYFSRGLTFTFPPGTSIAADGYLVIAENTNVFDPNDPNGANFKAKFGFFPDGVFLGKLNNDGENVELRNAEGVEIDQVDYQLGFPWPTVGDSVPFVKPPDGSGHSMQLTNPAFDNDLGGSWRSATPTPKAKNTAVYADNIPPQIRQVKHDPEQPTSSDAVTITCKVTDPNDVNSVTLHYQIVDPGGYIPITLPDYNDSPTSTVPNPDYEDLGNWTDISMHDDGNDGDEIANDDIYSVQLSASLQVHRRLIRYRITVEDTVANSIKVPYPDDPQPNFAYFVHDGVPAWSGADEPGTTPVVTYGTDVMRSLPVYHLISREQDVMDCQWLERISYTSNRAKIFYWAGTLVYDGKVYDHITYRMRGGTHRYCMGKNFWKFDFKRGRYFQSRDNYGNKYKEKWDKLNLGNCITQWCQEYRGEQGMFEALTFKLFDIVGVPSSNTHWIQLRIIDEANEAYVDQYRGDFWGLYLVIEQMDGRFLDERDLPDGNLYKMEGGSGELNNLSPIGPDDKSDLDAFISGYTAKGPSKPDAAWWFANVNVNCYYSYRTIIEATRHYDINYGKNYFYYHEPITDIWSQLPWDLNLTWRDDYCIWGNGDEPFKDNGLLDEPELYLEYQNRVREIRNLLFNTDQAFDLLDEYGGIIDEPNAGGLSFSDVDRAMWDYNPVMTNTSYGVNLGEADNGWFYWYPPTHDFPGMVQVMKDFAVKRINTVLDPIAADSDIPSTPTITYTGSPNYPANDLTFETSSFSDPQGSGTFAALKWRIGEVTDENSPSYDPAKARKYEIEAAWESEDINDANNTTVTIPASFVKEGHAYRVRCRMKDNTDRWSRWSDPNQFVAGEPLSAGVLDYLRITELMYNPADGSDFEFVELKNTGPNSLDLNYVYFDTGITFDFNDGNVPSLDPCDFVLVVRNQVAFESRYPALVSKIAGQYIGGLANGGENIRLVDYWNGTIAEFEYEDGRANSERAWPLAADGIGHSLVPLDSALPDEPDGSLGYGGNWRASTYMNGSPGQDDTPLTTVVLNEIMAHTDYSDPCYPNHDSNDWIELYNTTGSTVNLNSNWYLSDDIDDLKQWALPSTAISGN
ncbi:MAG: lamin tail domain-containing protein, partial [Planctomycetota bacterium]